MQYKLVDYMYSIYAYNSFCYRSYLRLYTPRCIAIGIPSVYLGIPSVYLGILDIPSAK